MAVLNVIFHGMFAFIPDKSGITAVVPELGVEHVYFAGKWRHEIPLIRGRKHQLHVTGTKTMPRVSDDEHAVIHCEGAKPNLGRAYCTVRLPFPDHIMGLRHAPFGQFRFTGSQKCTCMRVPTVEAFVYEGASADASFSPANPWSPDGNLHLFADPSGSERTGSNSYARLKKCVLPEPDVDVTFAEATYDLPLTSDLEGVSPRETADLRARDLGQGGTPEGPLGFPCFFMKR